jgi:hypothetical protein
VSAFIIDQTLILLSAVERRATALQHAIVARQRRQADEARQRDWAKAGFLLRQALEGDRQREDAEREAEANAVRQHLSETLEGARAMARHAHRELARRLAPRVERD